MKLQKKAPEKEIPIFFSTDDNYIPYLDIAISSLIENASKNYKYRLVILNTGLNQEGIDKIKRNENDIFKIDFVDISKEVENIKDRFKNVYHFSVVTYYRLFIASLFPQYDKIVYLDCDLVVLGDISELYHTELNGNIFAAAVEQYTQQTKEFQAYVKNAIGVNPSTYINAGVLVIDLEQFRKHKIEEKFVHLISEYDFDVVDPDQAYLNYLCYEKILILPTGWNKVSLPTPPEGKLNIVHFALYKKPWQYDDVINGEHFWKYAEKSPFYDEILKEKNSFSKEEMVEREQAAAHILEHTLELADSDYTFAKKLTRE